MDERIILYTTPGCDVCDNARSDLKAAKVDFEERNVMKNKGWFDEALRYSVCQFWCKTGGRRSAGKAPSVDPSPSWP